MSTKTVSVILCLIVCILISTIAFGQDTTGTKKDDLQKLLSLTGSAKMGEQVMTQMTAALKPMLSNVSEKSWNEFVAGFTTGGLMDSVMMVYDKYFTDQDIKDMIKFYETPTGKKVTSTMPLILQESMMIGQRWGQDFAKKAMMKFQEGQK